MRRRVRWDRGTRRRPQTGRSGVGNGAKRRPHVARRTNAAHPSACVATPNTATTKKRRSVAIAHHIFRCDEKCGLGGGSKAAKGGLGGGALALLGALALQAFRNASGKPQETLQLDHAAKLAAGLRAPANEQEEQEMQAVAKLIVRAMVNAAKADGHIDESEMKRITGNLEKDGISGQERELLAAELRKPLDTDSLVRAVPSPQVAAQVYAASLLAVDLDTDAEKQYLADLARRLALDANVVRHLHGAVGAA